MEDYTTLSILQSFTNTFKNVNLNDFILNHIEVNEKQINKNKAILLKNLLDYTNNIKNFDSLFYFKSELLAKDLKYLNPYIQAYFINSEIINFYNEYFITLKLSSEQMGYIGNINKNIFNVDKINNLVTINVDKIKYFEFNFDWG